MRTRRTARLWIPCLLALLSAASNARAGADSAGEDDCLACHEDRSLRTPAGESAFVDAGAFRNSAHGRAGVACVACHADLKSVAEFPHQERLAPASCVDCHEREVAAFGQSVHAGKQAKLGGRAPACADCHDPHRAAPKSEPASATSPFHVQELCLGCHRRFAPEARGRDPGFVASYEKSIHARALEKSGLGVAATCVSCHGSHDVRSVSDPASPVRRGSIPATCGSCHAGIVATYRESVHGRRFAAGNTRSPVCTDCHGEHRVEAASVPSSKVYSRNVPETCGRCHGDEKLVQQLGLATKRVASFAASFHGIALRFGELKVANCASCHGYHDIVPASDPRSRVHTVNIPKTCGACHANAGTNWARGKVHVAEAERDNYAVHLTRRIYRIGIAMGMGLFMLYIGADLWGHRRRRKG